MPIQYEYRFIEAFIATEDSSDERLTPIGRLMLSGIDGEVYPAVPANPPTSLIEVARLLGIDGWQFHSFSRICDGFVAVFTRAKIVESLRLEPFSTEDTQPLPTADILFPPLPLTDKGDSDAGA